MPNDYATRGELCTCEAGLYKLSCVTLIFFETATASLPSSAIFFESLLRLRTLFPHEPLFFPDRILYVLEGALFSWILFFCIVSSCFRKDSFRPRCNYGVSTPLIASYRTVGGHDMCMTYVCFHMRNHCFGPWCDYGVSTPLIPSYRTVGGTIW